VKNDILSRIVEAKKEEVAERRRHLQLERMKASVPALPVCRDFRGALEERARAGRPGIIAEIKRASPSAGRLREDFDPGWLAGRYEKGGAACLSVLTDEQWFQGSEAFLLQARSACKLPVLRKEFIIDEWQVWETRALAADAILLIAAILDDDRLQQFSGLAGELGMTVLVEVHSGEEMDRVQSMSDCLIGINNRNLRTFETRLETSLELIGQVPEGAMAVSESGIGSASDLRRLMEGGIGAFLVGESLMRQSDPGKALEELISGVGRD